jgi:hypothetical protein
MMEKPSIAALMSLSLSSMDISSAFTDIDESTRYQFVIVVLVQMIRGQI